MSIPNLVTTEQFENERGAQNGDFFAAIFFLSKGKLARVMLWRGLRTRSKLVARDLLCRMKIPALKTFPIRKKCP
jgi:hypothetical protein